MDDSDNNRYILFFGHQDIRRFKRGVENVIISQYEAYGHVGYYIFIGEKCDVYYSNRMICIEVPRKYLMLHLNLIIFKLLFLKKKKILIHSHHYIMSMLSIFHTDIFTTHDALTYFKSNQSNQYKPVHLIIFTIIENIVYFKAKCFHFISEFTFSNAKLKTKKKAVYIIGNTTPLENYSDKKLENIARESKKPYAICVRSMDTRYNIELLIEVGRKLDATDIDLKILLIGKGPLLDHYMKMAEGIKSIIFIGYVSDYDLSCYYSNSEFTIVTASWGEGFGIPVIESYLFNKLSFAPNICALPENIIHQSHLYSNNADDLLGKIINYKKYCNHDFKAYYNSKYSNFIIREKYKLMYKSYLGVV